MHQNMNARGARRLFLAITAMLLLLVPAGLFAQVDRGVITGRITDTTNAVIPAVKVTATEEATNAQYATVSNGLGIYSLLNLPIGTYTIKYQKQGFKATDHPGITLLANHTSQVNVQLEAGSAVETVTVKGNPILQLQPEVGTNMTQQEINSVPLSIAGAGRDQLAVAFAVTPNVSGDTWYSSVNGSQQYTKNVMIDGTSIDSGVMGDLVESGPSLDAVQQVQVDTNGLGAEESRTGGGAFMLELKSGTNKWHGSAFGFLTNEDLDANTWDNNWWLSQCGHQAICPNGQPRSAYGRARNCYFDYGFSGGGPIWKNHTFFYVAYEKYTQDDWRTIPNGATAPTTKMLNGDFSELLAQGAQHPGCTADPCPTGYNDPAGNPIYFGSVFLPDGTVAPGNIIPAGIWGASAISQKVLAIYKQYYKPTLPGVTNNFPMNASLDPHFAQYQFSIKFDHNFSDRDHFASSYIWNHRPKTEMLDPANIMWEPGKETGGPLTPASHQELHTNAYRFSETHTFSPTLLNVASFTFNQFQNVQASLAPAQVWASTLGINSAYPDQTPDFPQLSYSGSPNGVQETTVGSTFNGGYVAYNGILDDSVSWTKGRHDFKFGGELRAIGFNANGGPQGALSLNFTNGTFVPYQTDANFASNVAPFVGFAFANMGLGEVANGSQAVPFNQYGRRKEYALFAQDDWKITPRLTASLGLRWDITGALHELHGHWSNFSLTAKDPHFGGLPGAFVWLKHPGDSFETDRDLHQFGPHLGVSYMVTNRSVIRGSYGLMYSPIANNQFDAVPYGSAIGYQGNNTVNPVLNQNGVGMPAFQWDSGYPGTTTPANGPMPNQGYMQWGAPSIDPHSRQLGMIQNVFAGYEYQVSSDFKVDVNYSGAFGSNLHDGYGEPYNYPLWSQYQPLLMSGHANDVVNSVATAQAAGVNYPYQGWSQIAADALLQFPQVAEGYGPLMVVNAPIGRSGYNSFTVEATKRGRNGLAFNLSFTHSRQTGNVCDGFLEEWSYGACNQQDPHQYNNSTYWGSPLTSDGLKGFVTYQLPIGRGRRFLGNTGHLLNEVVGGWGVSTIVSYSNGGQFGAVWSTNSYPGWLAPVWSNVKPNANFKNTFKRWDPAWNPLTDGQDNASLFVDPSNFSNPQFGQLGNSPKYYQGWRNWAAPSENASIIKHFNIGESERYTASIRADFFNVFNRHYWGGPNLDMSSPYFGHVTGVSGNRTGQIGARFQF